MSKNEPLNVEKARIVLVAFDKEKDRYSVAKALAKELSCSFEEASEIIKEVPVELMQPLPIEAAENLAERLRPHGAEIEIVPLSRDLGGGRTCYRHPHKLAMAKCKVCGKLLCNVCLLETKGKFYCTDHFARFKFWRVAKYGLITLAVILMTVIWILFQDNILRLMRNHMPVSTQRVALVVFTNKAEAKASLFFNDLMRASVGTKYKEGDEHSLKDLDGWFQLQFMELTGDKKADIIDLDIYGMFEASSPPPGFGLNNASKEDIKEYVKHLTERNKFHLSAYDYYLFIYLIKKTPVDLDFMEQLNVFEGKFGIYLYPMERTWSNDYYIMGLGHMLARMMGATVKLDDKGYPLFPEGYGQPSLEPKYPQPYAELMGCYLPVKRFSLERVTSLDQAVIGPKTANELGWVSRSFVRKAYSKVK